MFYLNLYFFSPFWDGDWAETEIIVLPVCSLCQIDNKRTENDVVICGWVSQRSGDANASTAQHASHLLKLIFKNPAYLQDEAPQDEAFSAVKPHPNRKESPRIERPSTQPASLSLTHTSSKSVCLLHAKFCSPRTAKNKQPGRNNRGDFNSLLLNCDCWSFLSCFFPPN